MFIILILITGCNGTILMGPAGVDLEFAHPEDNSELLATYDLVPTLHIKNKGEADSVGTVCIWGLDKDVFPQFLGCECQQFGLTEDEDKISVTTSYHEDYLMFDSLKIQNPIEDKEYGISAFIKYDYKTTANVSACIKEEIYSDKGCIITSDAEGQSLRVKSSSGPITIDNIRQRVYPKTEGIVDMIFMVDVSNSGTGNLFDDSHVFTHSCESPDYPEKTIRVKMDGLPYSEEIFCGNIKLDDTGKGTAYCEVPDYVLIGSEGESLFSGKNEFPVTITTEYTYQDFTSTSFTIVEKEK